MSDLCYFDLAKKSDKPIECDQKTYDNAFNDLPPKFCRGCWALGEPYSSKNGKATYYFFSQRGDKFFIFLGTKDEAEAAFGRY